MGGAYRSGASRLLPTATTRRCWPPPWTPPGRLAWWRPGRERPPGPRLRLGAHPEAPARARPYRGGLREGEARTPERDRTMGRRAHQLLAECPQEALVVHRAKGAGGGLLGSLLGSDHHRKKARSGGLETLPLGRTTLPTTIAYWRKLLAERLIKSVHGAGAHAFHEVRVGVPRLRDRGVSE